MNIRARETKDGVVWQVTVSVGNRAQGYKRIARTVGPFPGAREAGRKKAEEEWRKLKAQIEAQELAFVQPSSEKIGEFIDTWLRRKRAEVRPTTWETYSRLAGRHIIPSLGYVPLAKLSPGAVQEWVDGLAASGLSTRTVSACRTVLRIAMQDAFRLGQVQQNVVDRTRAQRQAPRKVDAFMREELDSVLRAASPRWQPLLTFTAYSGLRRGEVLALRWEDVDLARGTVAVCRSLVMVGPEAVLQDDTKTDAGGRRFTLPKVALDALRLQRKTQAEDRLAAGSAYQDQGLVFATHEGGLLRPDNMRRALRAACKRAGVDPKPVHALRHTAASLQLAAGVPLETVSKRLGHKSRAVTADIYGHLMPEADKDAADTLDAFLSRHKGPTA